MIEITNLGLNARLIIILNSMPIIKKYLIISSETFLFWIRYIKKPIKKEPITFAIKVPGIE